MVTQGKVVCPDCLVEFGYPPSRGGQAIRCPKCNSPIRLPIVPGSLAAVTGSALAKKAAEEEEGRQSRYEDSGPEVYQPASFSLFFGVVAMLLAGTLWMSPSPRLSITLAAFAGLSGLVGIGLGLLSIINIWLNRGTYSGLGLAIPGVLLSVVFGGVTPVGPVKTAFAELGKQSKVNLLVGNMESIATAHQLYDDRVGRMPENILDASGKPLLSWRVGILPELGETQLFERFKLDEPWDSPDNILLVPLMPKVLSCTSTPLKTGHSACMHPVGPSALYSPTNRRISMQYLNSADGPAVTLILTEVNPELSRPWTQPADWEFNSADPRDGLPSEPLIGFGDASVVRLPKDVSNADLAAYISSHGKEPVAPLKKK